MTNACLMQMRRPHVRIERERARRESTRDPVELLASLGHSPEQLASNRELAAAHSQALNTLPAHLREVYLHCVVLGSTIAEEAKLMNTTIPTVKTRLFRARARVRSHLIHVWRPSRQLRKITRPR
ncbi:MAG: hypothetical protein KGN84_05265 [Acidobacteriota bacterium]|nr:hypothetical protein [Acidobacteriota bacterium]